MKLNRTNLFIVLIFLTGSNLLALGFEPQVGLRSNNNSMTKQKQNLVYNTHSSIFIDGDEDFILQKDAEGWKGDGKSYSSPITLSGYELDQITIWNTNLHFKIDNCVTSEIRLKSASNGYISNNIIKKRPESNFFSNAGIILSDSDNTIIIGNIISHNSIGVDIGAVTTEPEPFGITQYFTENASVIDNTIENSSEHGVLISCARSCKVFNNSILNNANYGVAIMSYYCYRSSSSDHIVMWNNFIENNPKGTSQALDEGKNITFQYNFWSDWTGPDTDSDGIVDEPYVIDSNAEDPYPLVSRLSLSSSSTTPLPPSFFIFLSVGVLIIVRRKREK